MKSFSLWLATAAAFGSITGTLLHPGIPEIVIAWAVVVGMFYGIGSIRTRRRTSLA